MCNSQLPIEELSLDDEETQSEDEEDQENIQYLRAKWLFDGSKTLDEVIEKLKDHIEYIKSLKEDGWELVGEVQDDYGPMKQKPVISPA